MIDPVFKYTYYPHITPDFTCLLPLSRLFGYAPGERLNFAGEVFGLNQLNLK